MAHATTSTSSWRWSGMRLGWVMTTSSFPKWRQESFWLRVGPKISHSHVFFPLLHSFRPPPLPRPLCLSPSRQSRTSRTMPSASVNAGRRRRRGSITATASSVCTHQPRDPHRVRQRQADNMKRQTFGTDIVYQTITFLKRLKMPKGLFEIAEYPQIHEAALE